MRRLLILAALAAATLVGSIAVPAQAENLRKREDHLQNRLADMRQKYVRKQATWGRNHPHATRKDVNHLLKWDRRYARRGSRLNAKAQRVEAHIERKHARHD